MPKKKEKKILFPSVTVFPNCGLHHRSKSSRTKYPSSFLILFTLETKWNVKTRHAPRTTRSAFPVETRVDGKPMLAKRFARLTNVRPWIVIKFHRFHDHNNTRRRSFKLRLTLYSRVYYLHFESTSDRERR